MTISFATMALWIASLLAAAVSDWRSFRIPNILPGFIIILFLAAQSYSGFTAAQWGHGFHFLIALSFGMVLFALRWIGGGDAKLYAAIALWFDMKSAVILIFMTGISGLLLAICYLIVRMFIRRKGPAKSTLVKRKQERRIPYGVAISIGAVLTASFIGWAKLFPGIGPALGGLPIN